MLEMMVSNLQEKFINGDHYISTHASMADIVLIAKQVISNNSSDYGGDKTVEMNTELLEYILFNVFGFDKRQKKFKDKDGDELKFNWYEEHTCTHRTRLTNEVVTTSRFVGVERLDEDWYNTGLMSNEAWKVYKGV